MLDKELVDLIARRIQLEKADQNKQLDHEIKQLKEEMGAKGALLSGATITLTQKLCAQTVKNRAQMIWQTLHRFIVTSGIIYSDGLADNIKQVFRSHFPEKLNDITDNYRRNVERIGSQDLINRTEESIYEARSHALTKIETEIDLFIRSLKAKDKIDDESTTATFNIYSPVGAIQTGTGSAAYVSQNIDTEAREMLFGALEIVEKNISQSVSLSANFKDELLELTQESKTELNKEKPNLTKLRSALTTVGTSIQMLASAKPAYEALKAGLAYIGITLP